MAYSFIAAAKVKRSYRVLDFTSSVRYAGVSSAVASPVS